MKWSIDLYLERKIWIDIKTNKIKVKKEKEEQKMSE